MGSPFETARLAALFRGRDKQLLSSLRTQFRRMGGAKRYPSIPESVTMGIASLHPSYDRCDLAFSRRGSPEVCISMSLL